jgi:hypothetical protein
METASEWICTCGGVWKGTDVIHTRPCAATTAKSTVYRQQQKACPFAETRWRLNLTSQMVLPAATRLYSGWVHPRLQLRRYDNMHCPTCSVPNI